MEPVLLDHLHPSGTKLRAYYFQNPPGRTYTQGWRAPYQALPLIEDFVNHFGKQPEQSRKQFYNFDARKYGLIGEEKEYFMTSDNSILSTSRRLISGVPSRKVQAHLPTCRLSLRSQGPSKVLEAEIGLGRTPLLLSYHDKQLTTMFKGPGFVLYLAKNILIVSEHQEEESRTLIPDGTVRRRMRNGVV